MPTYTYACTACGHRFDAVQSIKDDPLAECPECAGALRRVIGAVGVSFKGSGFYRTDSRAGAKADGGGAGPKDAAPKESGSSSPAAKSPAATSAAAPPAAAPPRG